MQICFLILLSQIFKILLHRSFCSSINSSVINCMIVIGQFYFFLFLICWNSKKSNVQKGRILVHAGWVHVLHSYCCSIADYASSYVYGYMKCIESIDQYLQDKQIPQTLQCDVHSYLVSLIRGRNKLHNKPEVNDQSLECMDRSCKNMSSDLNDELSKNQSDFHVMCDANSLPFSNSFHQTDTSGCVWRPW